ncbi:hypothetical protein [Paenibacillus sp. y28]
MSSHEVKQEAKRIAECCSKIESLTSEIEIRNQIAKIKEACAMMEHAL